MIGLLLAALGLGLAGLDPAGALFAAGALAAGARERHVLAFGLLTCLGTAAFGTALSLTVGPRITDLDWGWFFSSPGALIEAALGLVLVAWGLARAWRPSTHAPKPRSPRGTGPLALLALAVLFALMAILDPTFDALVVIAGRGEPFWSVAVAHSVWIAVSQAPLVLLLAAMASGEHRRFVARFQSWWEKIRPAVGRIVTAAALLVALSAIEFLRRQLASELGPHGIRAVSLQTGGVPETIPESFEGREQITEGIVAPTMLERAATLEDVGNVAAFAASEQARTMTATALNISCGAIVD